METENKSVLLRDLNAKQLEAVLSPEDRLLVLAGAGAGKTKTLTQRILYLIFEKNVKPENILAVTFTKDAANEMIDRLILFADKSGAYKAILEDKNISQKQKEWERTKYQKENAWLNKLTIKTFHSVGYNILRSPCADMFDKKFRILLDQSDKYFEEEKSFKRGAPESISEILHKLIVIGCEDKNFLLKLKKYILDYYVDDYRLKKSCKENYYEKPYKTLRGERVRSKSERYIADWLYQHGIDYSYEPEVQFKDFPFKPDFFIPEADIFIEHVSNLSHPMKDKEEQFRAAGRIVFKTYEPMVKDLGKFYESLERMIFPKMNRKITKSTALNFEEEFRPYHKELKDYTDDVKRFIDMFKTQMVHFDPIYKKGISDQHERVRVFYEFSKYFFEGYRDYCLDKSYIDFNDLLLQPYLLLSRNDEARRITQDKYKYILVDEFQDVNEVQMRLLMLLLAKDANLFCVGDDWQSIYGWRGSNVSYIVEFEKHFPDAEVVKFDTNYRSKKSIVAASNKLISYNKYKMDKEITSFHDKGGHIHLYASKKEEEDGVDVVIQKIKQLIEGGYKKEDIMILYRRSSTFKPYRARLKEEDIKVSAMTMHKSKGLEAKAVFIIGLLGGDFGFPFVRDADRIFQIIKKTDYKLLLEEERRVMYVAMTRAKESAFLITEAGNESSFIDELPAHLIDRTNFLNHDHAIVEMHCEQCDKRFGEDYAFCPSCGSALVKQE